MELTDKELMQAYYEAVECQDGRKIKQLWAEMSLRNAND